jgi:hypothetical protein
MDIAAAVQTLTADTERSAELDRRDREYGGLVPSDRLRDDIAAAVAAWMPPYRPETTLADVRQACAEDWRDPREIKTARLMFDVSRAVRRHCRAHSKADQDVIANGAALLLLRWPTQGTSPVLDLGGRRAERETLWAAQRGDAPRTARAARLAGTRMSQLDWIDRAERLLAIGTLPLRRDWLDENNQPTPLARRALHAACKQAADEISTPSAHEISTDPVDISLLIEGEAIASGDASRLPDEVAPELVARYLDLPLDAARAIVARSFPHASPSDLAKQWGDIGRQAVANALCRGAIALRERYPDPAKLLADLATIGPAYRTDCERGAILALIDYREGWADEPMARSAVDEWRAATDSMGDVERALLAAARQAIKRAGGSYGSERAERVAGTVARLLSAEQRAAWRVPTMSTAPHKAGSQDWLSGYGTHRARRESVAERRALYALCAADESAAQGLISRIADTAHRVPAPDAIARPSASRLRRSGALDKCARSAQRAERKHLAPDVAQRVAADRERVRRLLESGSANADEIKSLRAGIAAAVGA